MKNIFLCLFLLLYSNLLAQKEISFKAYSIMGVGNSHNDINTLSCLIQKGILPNNILSKRIVFIQGQFIIDVLNYNFDDCIFFTKNGSTPIVSKALSNPQNTAETSFGISLISGENNVIAKNDVWFNGANVSSEITPNTNEPVAIEVKNTLYATVECNNVDKTYTGMRVVDVVDGLHLSGNTFAKHSTGLRYAESVSSINIVQNNLGNTWSSNPLDYDPIVLHPTIPGLSNGGGAINVAYYSLLQSNPFNAPLLLDQQRYENDNLLPPTYYPDGPSPLFPNRPDWFPQVPVSNFDCNGSIYFMTISNNSSGNLSSNSSSSLSSLEQVAQGTLPVAVFETEVNKQEQRNLYDKMKEDPTLHNVSTIVDSFYVESESSHLKDMYDAKTLKEAIDEQAPTEKNELEVLKEEMNTIVAEIFLKDSIHANDTILDTLYLNEKEILLDSLEIKRTEASVKEGTIQVAKEQKADESINKFNTIIDQEVIDYNIRYTDKLWMAFSFKNYQLQASDISELWLIANQCPTAGGKGVFSARSLLNTVIDTFWIDYDRCLQAGFDTRKTDGKDVDNTFILAQAGISIYPNPAKEKITIKLDKDYEVLHIQLTGILGNEVLNKKLYPKDRTIELSLKNVSFGTYIISLKNGIKELHSEKLIIE